MNKNSLFLIALGAIVILGVYFLTRRETPPATDATGSPSVSAELAADEVVEELVENQSTEVNDGDYEVVKENSIINWEGRKPRIVGYTDSGTLNVKSGSWQIVNGQPVSGEIIIDMASLAVTAVAKGGADGLQGHLSGPDFFDIANYPEASIRLIGVEAVTEEVDLAAGRYDLRTAITIKGITNEVIIPVTIYSQNNQVVMVGQTELDRTLWDIRYGSDKFFDNLADNMIDDNFGVNFQFTAIAR